MSTLHNYTSIADIEDFWKSDIAPQYFNFEDTNQYKVGIFGYINEVMATTTADVFNAVNIAKREFYSSTAQNISSFNKQAGIFDVDIPMTIPAECMAAIFILEKDILANSTISNSTYTFILDNSMEIMADSLQFRFDYPIRIIGRYLNGAYAYTTYYDTTKHNSLNTLTSKYLQNKTLTIEGRRYVVINVPIHQYIATDNIQVITKNSDIETVSVMFQYDGDIAGFDVFYTSDPGSSTEVYIPAYTASEITPAGAYCIFDFMGDNKLRITFPKNSYFMTKLNAEVRCRIYTSEGANGNFDEFLSDLVCNCKSDEYPYNNGLIVRGVVNGKCSGGKDKKSDDEFIREIREKNCTNGTITNTADLQIFFNRIINDNNIRVEFSKNRDDAFQRLYGAFILLKDDNDNIIPSNTCNLIINKSDFDVFENGRGIIKPGKIFKYSNSDSKTIVLSDLSLSENLDIYDSGETQSFLFTNPFLIAISVENGIVGYYGNSISDTKQVEFSFIEDRSFYQFICLGLQIERNPIAGESFYTFTTKISASSDIDFNELVVLPEETDIIRAKYNGRVVQNYFKDGAVWCKIEYDVDDPNEKYEEIQVSTYTTNVGDEFTYHIGNEIQFEVLDTFVQGDVIAKKKVTDLGKLRSCLDLNGVFLANGLYIPMYIEGYDKSNDVYTLKGYVSTNDFISLNMTVVLDHGVYYSDATMDDFVSVPMEDISAIISIFYKDDTANFINEYSTFRYFKNYTQTNKYTTSNTNLISLVKGITFIRSNIKYIDDYGTDDIVAKYNGRVIDLYIEDNALMAKVEYDTTVEEEKYLTFKAATFVPLESGVLDKVAEYEMNYEVGDSFTVGKVIASKKLYNEESDDYRMKLSSVPVVKSNWIKNASNFDLFINKIYSSYDALYEAYFQLENQYGISMAFFNTYGTSNRYEIGNYTSMHDLSSVNCSISLGIELQAMTNSSVFIEKYRTYIKDAIESFNDVNETGKSLYIIDLLAKSKEEFPEIVHIEYYGFNNYDHGAQIITPKSTVSGTSDDYVPEFVNIYTYNKDGINIPKIDIRLINYTALT